MEVITTTGKRKTAIARVFFKEGKGSIVVNHKPFISYFPTSPLQAKIMEPLKIVDAAGKYDIVVNVNGGGINGQADAICLGIARGLCKINSENRKPLKDKKLLTRDSRIVERKKSGLKKARKGFQFSKR